MSARSVVQRPRSRIAPMPALSTTKTVHADGPPLGAAGATRPVARRRSCSHARCVPGSARRLASHRGVVHDEPRRLPRVARRPARTSCPSRRSAPTCTPSPSRLRRLVTRQASGEPRRTARAPRDLPRRRPRRAGPARRRRTARRVASPIWLASPSRRHAEHVQRPAPPAHSVPLDALPAWSTRAPAWSRW
jgi:hypothetical protein